MYGLGTFSNRHAAVLLGGWLLSLITPMGAVAGPISLDFSTLPASASTFQIQNYLQNALTSQGYAGTVTVTGAVGANGYTGEGHAVGPVSGSTVSSVTLGSNGQGNFIINQQGVSDRITMTFSKPIDSIRFNYEIFPNGSVPDGSRTSPSNFPDFTFNAFLDGQLQANLHAVSVMPGTNGTFAHSPASGPIANEMAPQLIGSASFVFPNGANRLEFIDWPETIGINGLSVNITATPEPASFALFGAVLVGLFLARRGKSPRTVATANEECQNPS